MNLHTRSSQPADQTASVVRCLYQNHSGPFSYGAPGIKLDSEDTSFIRGAVEPYIYPDCKGLTYFVAQVCQDDLHKGWKSAKVAPTVVLTDTNLEIRCWALQSPCSSDDPRLKSLIEKLTTRAATALSHYQGAIPLPGADLYRVAYSDAAVSYTIDALVAAFVPNVAKPAPQSKQKALSVTELIETDINRLNPLPGAQAVEPIISRIATLEDDYEEERLLQKLAAKKIRIGVLRTMLARRKREKGCSGGIELKYDKQGRAIFRYHGSFNDDDLVKAVRTTLRQKNDPHASNQLTKPTPKITVMLGKPMKMRERDGETSIEELDQGAFHAEVCENFLMQNAEGAGANKHVKQDISNICFKTVQDYLPQGPDIVRNPLFDSQLNLIREPGWYRSPVGTQIDAQHNIYLPRDCLRVRDVSPNPSREELNEAVKLVRDDLLGEFPFLTVDKDGVERRAPAEANAIAMLLTRYVRRAIPGHTPMFFVSKPTPGTGGTLLGRLPMILDGLETTSINLKKGEEEIAKGIVAAILSSRMCMFFDNVKGRNINSDIILVSLTSRMVGDRLLGQSKLIERPNTYLWIATGNNPIILEELNRRIVWINLNAKRADLKNRIFKKELEVWAHQNRADVVWALLTIIQSWVANGKKAFAAGRKLPSFDKWVEVIGGILENAGIEGFLDTPERIAADEDQSDAKQLVREWSKSFSVELTTKQLIDFATSRSLDAWSGKSEEDKRLRFEGLLASIDGRTFDVEREDAEVMVRKIVNRDGDVAFTLVDVFPEEAESTDE